MKSNILYDEQRIKVAQEALSGTKLSYLARKYSVSPSTITNWVKFYKERFGEESLPSVSEWIREIFLTMKAFTAFKSGGAPCRNIVRRSFLRLPRNRCIRPGTVCIRM
ncbi:helix-turn-helix domain-containing protein [Paenibacillus alginolyticus]|uniref:helix-turn-helix domain-containing protein n=1 Tax=Paenibacillus alginolyticus TaxID=59839 RepID=UPI0013787C78